MAVKNYNGQIQYYSSSFTDVIRVAGSHLWWGFREEVVTIQRPCLGIQCCSQLLKSLDRVNALDFIVILNQQDFYCVHCSKRLLTKILEFLDNKASSLKDLECFTN